MPYCLQSGGLGNLLNVRWRKGNERNERRFQIREMGRWMKEGALTKTRTKERTCFGEKGEDLVVDV